MGDQQTLLNTPLSDSDWDNFADLLDEFGEGVALNLEGVDGVLAALACGPRNLMPSAVLPLVFQSGEMPVFRDEAQGQTFYQFSMRRMNEWSRFLNLPKRKVNVDNLVLPSLNEVTDEEMAQADNWVPPPACQWTDQRRAGSWLGRDWARGFMLVVNHFDQEWMSITEHPDEMHLLAPFLMLDLGFSPDKPETTFDPLECIKIMPMVVRRIDEIFREQFVERSAPLIRQQPKVGRNDPCPCGSGRKFKHCCGAPGKVN